MPKRIQLKRVKGWRMPSNTVKVARGATIGWGTGGVMGDENSVIRDVLLEMGLYSLALAFCGNEAELMKLFVDDFDGLMARCAKGI